MQTADQIIAVERPLILIVDDVRSNQQILANLLKDQYALKVASSGSRALELAKQHPELALILLDVIMPGMDGYEVCQHLKADVHTRDIPVIFITAADDETSESYGLNLGAIDYITKPIKPIITKLRIDKNIALREFQKKLHLSAKIIENSKESIVITDIFGTIIDVNPAYSQMTGYSRAEAIGNHPRNLNSDRQNSEQYQSLWQELTSKGYWSGELWNCKKSGEYYPEWQTIVAIKNSRGEVSHYVSIGSDISELKHRESQLEHIAHYDLLTAIPNRVLLADRMKLAIAQTRRDHKLLGVCYLDLDGFKPVNDRLGHQAGDQVLIEVAQRISQCIRAGDTVARLGGDEFGILLVGLEREDECTASIERILTEIRRPINLQGQAFMLGASVGVTLFPIDDEDPETLIMHADHAMYAAKQSGKNAYYVYSPEKDSDIRQHHDTLKRIKYALKHNEFALYYQPKLELATGKLVGAEALIRWQNPERGLVLPAEFLALMEANELITELGDWVIDQALWQLKQWQDLGSEIQISINVAGKQMQESDFSTKLAAALANYPSLPSSLLELEVLETSALEMVHSTQIIETIRTQLGVSFALDDFGTGYSSLTYLKTLPVKTLKIDQSFVQDMLEDEGDKAIVLGIIAMAKAFKRKTVAEGVESRQHYEALRAIGCDIGQGHGIARPMPAAEFLAWCTQLDNNHFSWKQSA